MGAPWARLFPRPGRAYPDRVRSSRIAGLFVLVACTRAEPVEFPPFEGPAELYFIELDDGWLGWASEGAPPSPYATGPIRALYRLQYGETLAALGLLPGPLALVPEGRRLPPPAMVWSAPPSGRPFSPSDGAALNVIRVAPIPLEACAGPTRCWTTDGAEEWCRLDCAEPEPLPAPGLPTPPAPPQLLPCPVGWGEFVADERAPALHTCAPTPLPCGADEVAWPGELSCDAEDCPRWPPGAHDLYVDPTATAGGDGSAARPYRDLSEAWSVAGPGASIALAAGDHLLTGALDRPVELSGACSRATRLSAPGPIIEIRNSTVSLSRMTLARRLVVRSSQLELDRLVVEAPGPTSLDLSNSRVRAARIQVRGASTGVLSVGGQLDLGPAIVAGEQVGIVSRGEDQLHEVRVEVPPSAPRAVGIERSARITRSVVVGGGVGIRIDRGVVDAEDLRIEGSGYGIFACGGALTLERTSITGMSVAGVVLRPTDSGGAVRCPAPQLTAKDVVVLDVGGAGLLQDTGTVALERLAVVRATERGVVLTSLKGTVSDVIVRDTASAPPPNLGLAYGMELGAVLLELERIGLFGLRGYGLLAGSRGGVHFDLTVHDLTVEDVTSVPLDPTTSRGYGVLLAANGRGELHRLLVRGAADGGLRTDQVEEVHLSDYTSLDCGRGLHLIGPRALLAERMEIRRPASVGALVELDRSAPTQVELRELAVIDDRPEPQALQGIWLETNATAGKAVISRARIEAAREGLRVESNWEVRLDDVSFHGGILGVATFADPAAPLWKAVDFFGTRQPVEFR